jgi:hypothetical protein
MFVHTNFLKKQGGESLTGGATVGGIDAATLADAAGALDGASGTNKRSANGAIKKQTAGGRGRGKGKAAQQVCDMPQTTTC